MTREELDKKIEEARKRSEVLSQAEIDDNSGGALQQIQTSLKKETKSIFTTRK